MPSESFQTPLEIRTSGVDDPDLDSDSSSTISTPDSLFDDEPSPEIRALGYPASLTAPKIPGLFFNQSIRVPEELAHTLTSFCMNTYFSSGTLNQVMLFGQSTFPNVFSALLSTLSNLLHPHVSQKTHDLLFLAAPDHSRQAIINLYHPGEGISPHIDLLGRYADGIVGVSLQSGCAMQFEKETTRYDLYLPERSVVVLTEEARYEWTHGIEGRAGDLVDDGERRWMERDVRLSITFRWLLPNADIVGRDEN